MTSNDSCPMERKQIINFYENKIKRLREILEETEELNRALLQENETLEKEISTSKRKVQSLCKTAEKLKGQEQTACKINDLLLVQKSAVQEDRANIKRENGLLKSKNKTLQEQLAVQEEKLARCSVLEKNLKDTTNELAGKAVEIEDLMKRVMQLEEENQELQMRLEQMERMREMDMEMALTTAGSKKNFEIDTDEESFEEEPQDCQLVEAISLKTEFESCPNFVWVTESYTQTELPSCSVTTQTSMSTIDFRKEFRLDPMYVSSSCFQIMPQESTRRISETSLQGENEFTNITHISSILLNTTCERDLPCYGAKDSPTHSISANGLHTLQAADSQLAPLNKSYKSEVHLEVFSARDVEVQTDSPHPSPQQSQMLDSPQCVASPDSSSQESNMDITSQSPISNTERFSAHKPALQVILFGLFSVLFPTTLLLILLLILLLLLYIGYHTAAEFRQPVNNNCFSKYEIISRVIKDILQKRMYLYYPYGPPPT